MDIRLARPTDVPHIVALILDEHAHIVNSGAWSDSRPSVRSVSRALVPFASKGRLWIVRDGESTALLEAQPRRYVIGWDITRLAVRGDPERILSPAVGTALEHVQRHGVPRLFARCLERYRGLLERCGFRSLGKEYVLLGSGALSPHPAGLPEDSRYRMPPDAWPLHQLESDTTPAEIRQLEGLTSLDWAQGSRGMEEIVVERDGEIVAWVGWEPGTGRRKRLGLLVRPDYRELGSDLLAYVLERTPPAVSFVARVRGYQQEVLSLFEESGFHVAAEEMLMLRHANVQPARSESARMRIAHVPGIQAFPFHLASGIFGPEIAGPLKDKIT
ncbi:MAG TPA: hypothetical protein VFB58_07395 [Chloroflexota bacterium]|nr:hypothetical protein [Chloroflexota bacterium]